MWRKNVTEVWQKNRTFVWCKKIIKKGRGEGVTMAKYGKHSEIFIKNKKKKKRTGVRRKKTGLSYGARNQTVMWRKKQETRLFHGIRNRTQEYSIRNRTVDWRKKPIHWLAWVALLWQLQYINPCTACPRLLCNKVLCVRSKTATCFLPL